MAALALALPALAAAAVRPAFGGTLRVGVPAAPRATGEGDGAVDLLVARALSAPLLELDPSGALVPGALAEVPSPEAGGRAFRLRLRPGLVDAAGRPLGAADVARRFVDLLSDGARSPNAWLALPVLGADAVLEGRAATLAGVQVLSPTELLVVLAAPLPQFPLALAATPLALAGAGPFVAAPRVGPGEPLRLVPNPRHHAGLPFAAAVEVGRVDARAAPRAVEQGALDLVLRPEAAGGRPGPALPALAVTVAALNPARLGAGTEPLRRALAALDRTELARRFARGAAEPLRTLVPPSILAGAPPPERGAAPAGSPPRRIVLVADAGAPDQRALAARIQVKLFDRGVGAALDLVDGPRLRARLAAGEYDVALVNLGVLAADPALAAAQVAWATRGAAAARRALADLAGPPPPEGALAVADRLARDLALVPLVAVAPRASRGPALEGLAARPDGVVDLAALWRLGPEAR
jgi:peptide/nickel transport system substrate-binding protein